MDHEERKTYPTSQRILDALEVTQTEYTILDFLSYEPPRPGSQATAWAAGWAEAVCHPVASRPEYAAAYRSLDDRGLIQRIDEQRLRDIQDRIDRDPALGPFEPLPTVGTIQLTWAGAELLQKTLRELHRGTIYEGVEQQCATYNWVGNGLLQIYSPSRAHVMDLLREELDDDSTEVLYVCGPAEVGPWRFKWWKRFDSGFSVDIFYREIEPRPNRAEGP